MSYVPSKLISMKAHPSINEAWVQSQICEDTNLLGLGNLEVLDKERRQPKAGRLDLLLENEGTETRYTVEIQLGATDESHIIRTIEYWDIERNRNPQINHVAVIIAEDVTSRFLNVISLFNKSIPIIAIQMNAFEVGENFTLAAVKILDTVEIVGMDEEEMSPATDRDYWLSERASEASLSLVDEGLKIVKDFEPDAQLNYRKRYIGLLVRGTTDNFVVFGPRRGNSMVLICKLPFTEETSSFIDESGFTQLTYSHHWKHYKVSIRAIDFVERKEQLRTLIGDSFKATRSS